MKPKKGPTNRREFLKSSAAAGALITLPFGASASELVNSGQRISLDAYKSGKKNREIGEHSFNGAYSGEYLNRVAFPIGGMGAGMFCMEGTGAVSHVSVKHSPELFKEAFSFAAISVKGAENGAKVLEAPVPEWKFFGTRGAGNGLGGANYGFPRFESGKFLPRFPFASIDLQDKDIPISVRVTGWSPFIPTDEDNSGLPLGVMEYRFENPTSKKSEMVFSYHSRNFIDEKGKILKAENGFTMVEPGGELNADDGSGFTIYVDDGNANVDYCWFRGGWFDSKTILWKNIEEGNTVSNPPVDEPSPGASIYVPLNLEPGESRTIKVNFCWYFPKTTLKLGKIQEQYEVHDEKRKYFKPWYSSRFKNLEEVVRYWNENKDELKTKSEKFRDAFFSSTLPDEVMEAVSANLTILKSPTVLRQHDGRFWAFEGCSDNRGCCHGSCTHVWNYAQALPHLFPALERTLRDTEFNVIQNEEGHQVFRTPLPIAPPVHDFHAATDGQLGGIMKIYRDWRISGDTEWMAGLFPKVKQSLDYCIETWDPKHQGFLEEPHHNTYDIEFWGPDGMCTSFYLGALTAFTEMSQALNKTYDFYETLLEKGAKYMEEELFDGEYFMQKVKWKGLKATDPVELSKTSWSVDYSDEAIALLQKEGPKYQYGTGCLSDGILGMWMATVCGLNEVVDNNQVTSHLVAVHKHNLKPILMDHINPQRPTFACGIDGGLLLCSWPKGGELSLPFIYSNEVWTGIEYQVAGHLMFKGEVEKGLEIVRICRDRYDGTMRNPFNEYECGNWYARAMAGYGMLQGLTGTRYDAVDKTLHIDSKIGDFKSFVSTATGFGTVELRKGIPSLEVVQGKIEVDKVFVSGKEKQLT